MDRDLIVFISSIIDNVPSSRELQEERGLIEGLIESMPLVAPWVWESKPVSSQEKHEYYIKGVRGCDIFVLLLDKTLKPGVKLEYKEAIKTRKLILAFVKNGPKDSDMEEFLDALPHKYAPFATPKELEQKVRESIYEEIRSIIHPHSRLEVDERIEQFKEGRVLNIITDENPVRLYGDHKVILHLIPSDHMIGAQRYDLAVLAEDRDNLQPFSRVTARPPQHNLDGLVSITSPDESGLSEAYIQVFTDGVIESVDSWSFIGVIPDRGQTRLLWINEFETCCINALQRYMRILVKLGIATPVYIFLTLDGVSGVRLLDTDANFPFPYMTKNVAIDRDFVPLPKVSIESYDKRPDMILKDVFDSLWKACGHKKSLNYKDDGSYSNEHRCL
jgi:hypothetical protein